MKLFLFSATIVAVSSLCDYITYFRRRGTVIGNRYGSGNGTIWLDNVHCVGNETSIVNCTHNDLGVHNCDHDKDVSVSCGTSPVQYGNFNHNNVRPVVRALDKHSKRLRVGRSETINAGFL